MSMQRLRVNMPDASSYEVRVGKAAIGKLGDALASLHNPCPVALITDTNVGPLYGNMVKDELARAGFSVHVLTVPAGEENKNLSIVRELWNALAALGLSRDGLVVSLGGGVIGDMAGFVAATYMRGLAFAQIPTSLLAMVDASVGGKNGVNLDEGKNLVGTFAQPIYVLCDIDFLASLPEEEFVCGCAEIAKTAVLAPDDFFAWLDVSAASLKARDASVVQEAIVRCITFKAGVVAADEHERTGLRECLNYGHTLGHAIESLAGYGAVSHGQAVAEGMRFAARLAVEEIGTPIDFVTRQDTLLDQLGLEALKWGAPPRQVLQKMHSDKKLRDGKIRLVLPQGIGQWESVVVSPSLLDAHLDAWSRSKKSSLQNLDAEKAPATKEGFAAGGTAAAEGEAAL